MSKKRSGSVSDLKALFETPTNKQETKPLETEIKRRHSMGQMWEDMFKIKQHELGSGPMKKTWTNTTSSAPIKPQKCRNTPIKPQTDKLILNELKEYEFEDNVSNCTYSPKISAAQTTELYEAKLETLTIEMEKFKSENNKLLETIGTVNKKIKDLTELKEYEFDNNVTDCIYTPEISVIQLSESYESKIKTLNIETETLKTENNNLLETVERLNKNMQNLKESHARDMEQFEAAKTQIGESQIENGKLNKIINELKHELYEQKDINSALTMEVQSLITDAEIAEMNTNIINTNEKEIEILRNENTDLRQTLVLLQKSKIDLAVKCDGEMQKLRKMIRNAYVSRIDVQWSTPTKC